MRQSHSVLQAEWATRDAFDDFVNSAQKTTCRWKAKPGKGLLSYRMNYFLIQVLISVVLVRAYLVRRSMLRTVFTICFPLLATAVGLFLIPLLAANWFSAFEIFAPTLIMFFGSWFGGRFAAGRLGVAQCRRLVHSLSALYGGIAVVLFIVPHYYPEIHPLELLIIFLVSIAGPYLGARNYRMCSKPPNTAVNTESPAATRLL
jgi:hypothetical protein